MAVTSTETGETENALRLQGPGFWRMIWMFHQQAYDIFPFMVELQRKYGDIASLPLRIPSYVIASPADLRHVLVTNPDNYHKLGVLIAGRPLLGRGLLTNEGADHHRKRRSMQPMFHRQKISSFATTMVDCVRSRMEDWTDGKVVNIAQEMTRITLSIISRTIFTVDLDSNAQVLHEAITVGHTYMADSVTSIQWPILAGIRHRRFLDAVARIDRALLAIIRERAQPGAPKMEDLLGMLLEAKFEDGAGMSEKELRDEVVTLFLAGHETTASSMSWTFKLLSENPEVEAALHREIDTVLQGRLPTFDDYPNLRYTEKIISESMRLYAPVWLMGRHILEDDLLPSGVGVKGGGQIIMVVHAAHRNPRYFPDPEKFRPERFEEKIGIAQGYFPFSAGVRSCIGESFARMEMVLGLAAICQRFRLRTMPGQKIQPQAWAVLRPKNGIAMRVENR